jgi:hypothetical protein
MSHDVPHCLNEPRDTMAWHGLLGRRLVLITCALVLAGAVAPRALGNSSIVYLGKPVNVVSPLQAFPLDGFRHVREHVGGKNKPELLFLGTLVAVGDPHRLLFDNASAMERWAVVKALDQFGSFSGVKQAHQMCGASTNTSLTVCYVPTFDWSHASYRSRYVTFAHRDLLDIKGRRYQPMSQKEHSLYLRYARDNTGPWISMTHDPQSIYYKDAPDYVHVTVTWGMLSQGELTDRRLPLVMIGSYLQTVSQFLSPASFEKLAVPTVPPGPGTPVPTDMTAITFDQVRGELASGRRTSTDARLVVEVNAEANIMSALICHADGKKPKSVCRRPAVASIMKHVK